MLQNSSVPERLAVTERGFSSMMVVLRGIQAYFISCTNIFIRDETCGRTDKYDYNVAFAEK
jgi:hypothetical protein